MSDPANPLSALISANAGSGDSSTTPPDPDEQTGGGGDPPDSIVWQPVSAAEDYDVRLADGSIRPMSESALRGMVLELRKAQMIDTLHALRMLDVPDADEIAEAVENELKLAALAKGIKR